MSTTRYQNNHFVRAIVLCLMFIASSIVTNAQDIVVNPITISNKRSILNDISIYVAGGRENHNSMNLASNNVYINRDVFANYIDIGVDVVFYKENSILRFSSSLGYRLQPYSFDRSLFANTGINSHFIATDIRTEILYFGAGLKSDIFLGSKVKKQDDLSLMGLHSKCFNPMSLCAYYAFFIPFAKFKIEARIGTYIVPHISPKKLAYYNFRRIIF